MSSNPSSVCVCGTKAIEERWVKLMLNWLNKCVHPRSTARQLNITSLREIMMKYKEDLCGDDINAASIGTEDVEAYLQFKYPLLTLECLCQDDDVKKLYIMSSVMLYHCCISSINGKVDSDICAHLDKQEQEIILKYCEKLTYLEVNTENVDTAIRGVCASLNSKKKPKPGVMAKVTLVKGSGESCELSIPNMKCSDESALSKPSSQSSKKEDFNSSATIQPSTVTEDSRCAKNLNNEVPCKPTPILSQGKPRHRSKKLVVRVFDSADTQVDIADVTRDFNIQSTSSELGYNCQPGCSCTTCKPFTPSCGAPGRSMNQCVNNNDKRTSSHIKRYLSENKTFFIGGLVLLLAALALVTILLTVPQALKKKENTDWNTRKMMEQARMYHTSSYVCRNKLCQKVFAPTIEAIYSSMSRCILLCMGPQLWPLPVGFTHYSNKIVALATKRLEYKFQSIPSEAVHTYLSKAFKLFIADLTKLEKINTEFTDTNATKDLIIKKMNIQLDVETDSDPRLRVDTDESYNLNIDILNNIVYIKISSPSFCGVRHGLETLSQVILLDQTTGYLLTLSNIVIRDGPTYKYRGLMIDTGRNYIPVPDLIRTVDAMATCKLNTFHWRISDVTSFPLLISTLPQLFEYGGYERSLVYTREDILSIVKRAGIRGIRVLIEVAAPGPVGRAWTWTNAATCPTKTENFTCSNVLCIRLAIGDNIMDILQIIYTEIIDMTNVEDIFHLSDGLFSLGNCFYLIEDRGDFLEKALERLKIANNGFMPKLPVIWHTRHLTKDNEAKIWDRLGVQLTEWQPNPTNQYLSRFKVIHSSKWDLSCEIKKHRCKKYRTWQAMYSWKMWKNIDVFNIEGGESMLWTDMINSANLDFHIWPRAAAVAERLWSDIVANGTAAANVYLRLDSHRWRLLLKSVKVQPIWPVYCSVNPVECLRLVHVK